MVFSGTVAEGTVGSDSGTAGGGVAGVGAEVDVGVVIVGFDGLDIDAMSSFTL